MDTKKRCNMFGIFVDADLEYKVNKSRTPYCVSIRGEEETAVLIAPLHAIINKGDTTDFYPDEQFFILNDYLAGKTPEYRKAIYDKYVEIWKLVDAHYDALDNNHIELYNIFYELFDMFDIDDMIKHAYELVDRGIVKIPSDLDAQMNISMIKDKIGSVEQTYLISDYVELIGLTTFIKATFPVLIKFDSLLPELKNGPKKDNRLYDIYANYPPFFESPPAVKLGEFAEQIVVGPKRKKEEIEQLALEKGLSRTEFKQYFVAQVVMEKLTVALYIRDRQGKYQILTNYSFLVNRSASSGSQKNKVKSLPTSSMQDGEYETVCEKIKQILEVPMATQVAMNVCTREMPMLLDQFYRLEPYVELLYNGITVNGKTYTVEDVRNAMEGMNREIIPETTVVLVRTFLKRIMDPRYIDILKIEGMLNCMTLAFIYMYNLGFKRLAISIGTATVDWDNGVSLYTGNDLKNLDDELLFKLRDNFPLYTPPGKMSRENTYIIEGVVKDVSRKFLDDKRLICMDNDFIDSVFAEYRRDNVNDRGRDSDLYVVESVSEEQVAYFMLPHSDLRKELASYLIRNEEIVNSCKR